MKCESEKKSVKSARKALSLALKYLLPLAISVGLCFALFRNMDFGEMIAFVRRECNFTLIFICMAVGFLAFIFRGLRWRIQLRAAGVDVGVVPVVCSIIGTYAVNIVLPRFGELWRCEYISRRQQRPFATVFGSMVAERMSDTLVVALIFLATLLCSGPILVDYLRQGSDDGGESALMKIISSPWTWVAIVAIVALAWGYLRANRHRPWVQKITRQISNLISGFASIFHMRGAWRWLLLTVLLWGSYIFQMWLCFEAFGLTRDIISSFGFIAVMVCFSMSSISMGVPSNGGIGPYQLAVVFGMKCFVPDIDDQSAFAFANLVLGAQMLINILGGLAAFAWIALDNHRR